MTEEQARAEVFGEIARLYDGYSTRIEPVTGRPFSAFVGVAFRREGEEINPAGVCPTPEEALRVHVQALKSVLAEWVTHFANPVVCVRMYPAVEQLADGGWIAATRLLVTSGNRDVQKLTPVALGGLPQPTSVPIRGVVVGDQPVVGVAQ